MLSFLKCWSLRAHPAPPQSLAQGPLLFTTSSLPLASTDLLTFKLFFEMNKPSVYWDHRTIPVFCWNKWNVEWGIMIILWEYNIFKLVMQKSTKKKSIWNCYSSQEGTILPLILGLSLIANIMLCAWSSVFLNLSFLWHWFPVCSHGCGINCNWSELHVVK